MSTIAALSVMGFPYYTRFLFIPLLSRFRAATSWHHNHWLGLLSLSSIAIGFGGISLSSLLSQMGAAPSAITLIIIGLFINIAGIFFEKSLDLYKIECSSPAEQAYQIFHEKFGFKIGRLCHQAGALLLAAHTGWALPYTLFSAIFLCYGGYVALIERRRTEHYGSQASEKSWDLPALKALAAQEWLFLFFCFCISLADQVTAYFMMLYLKDIGMSYAQIASLAKISGAVNITLGSWLAYYLWAPERGGPLLFYSCLMHMLTLMLLGYSQSISFLWVLFFFKNISLGAKSFLMSHFKASYIAQKNLSSWEKRGLFFLSSMMRSLSFSFCLLFGVLYECVSFELFFLLVGLLSLPGLIALGSKRLRVQYQ